MGFKRIKPLGLVGMFLLVPPLLGTVGNGILGGLASGTCWDVPCNPSTSLGLLGLGFERVKPLGLVGMSLLIPALLGTVGIGN